MSNTRCGGFYLYDNVENNMQIERVLVTEKAKAVIAQLKEKHGELMFHQSGGCCDGSAPMCFEKGDFIIGARDLRLGIIEGCEFYMASDQFQYYASMQITIDVSPGRGSSFSLEIPLGLRFMSISRIFSDEEIEHVKPAEAS